MDLQQDTKIELKEVKVDQELLKRATDKNPIVRKTLIQEIKDDPQNCVALAVKLVALCNAAELTREKLIGREKAISSMDVATTENESVSLKRISLLTSEAHKRKPVYVSYKSAVPTQL